MMCKGNGVIVSTACFYLDMPETCLEAQVPLFISSYIAFTSAGSGVSLPQTSMLSCRGLQHTPEHVGKLEYISLYNSIHQACS